MTTTIKRSLECWENPDQGQGRGRRVALWSSLTDPSRGAYEAEGICLGGDVAFCPSKRGDKCGWQGGPCEPVVRGLKVVSSQPCFENSDNLIRLKGKS